MLMLGEDMLKGSNIGVLNMVAEIALCHHERWDGQGYPNLLPMLINHRQGLWRYEGSPNKS